MKSQISSSKPKPNNQGKHFLSRLITQLIPFTKYRITGNSMLPTLYAGDEILIYKHAYSHKDPQVNDIVAVQLPHDDKILIKRVKKIENGKFFVMGDNENASTDSRKFGMLEKSTILGKLIYKSNNR